MPALWALGPLPSDWGVVGASAHTLDPHHPVWERPGIDRSALRQALSEVPDEVPRPRAENAAAAWARASAHGTRVLVVPVLPRDATRPPVDQQTLQRRWFGPGEDTVRGYWEWVSGGRLQLDGRVLPWVDVEGTIASDYFNILDGGPVTAILAGPRNLARDGFRAAATVVRDLSLFDDDGPDGIPGSGDDDGIIDLLVFLHPEPGWEIAVPPTGKHIVSLQARLREQDRRIETSELGADAFVVGSATAPLGVWVHELGHLLGLDDLYDVSLTVAPGTVGNEARLGGLGRWSLMASGTWGDGGARPSGLDPWSRRRLGWDEATVVQGRYDGLLAPVGAERAPHVEVRPLGDWGGERFLVENRRRRDGAIVDGALPASGVLVYRVDDRPGPVDPGSRWIELLQADGRDDLASGGGNDGDAGDPFTGAVGADRLDGTTNPATVGHVPSVDRVPPVLEIGTPDAEGRQSLRVRASEGALLLLDRADFEDPQRGDRGYLLQRESAEWRLAFVSVGQTEPITAQVALSVRPEGRPASVSNTTAIPLVREGGEWSPTETVILTDEGALDERGPILLDIRLSVDGGPERTIGVGVPVGLAPGLAPSGALLDFVPRVLAATEGDTTRFVRLGIGELPRSTAVGWGLSTSGERRYAPGSEVVLEGPWMAVPSERRLTLWSRHRTEEAAPGLAWDGGVLEIWQPDLGWRTLEPEGEGLVQILRASSAATRDRPAFGGDFPFWRAYAVQLPESSVPVRVRLRFGSDDFDQQDEGWWEVAGLGTERPPASARLEIVPSGDGGLRAVADLSGDLDALDQVRFRYRSPGEDVWLPASGLLGLRSDATTVSSIEVPEAVRVFEVGLFSELAAGGAGGSTPPLLLGSAGYRRSEEASVPRIMGNPARGRLVLQVPVRQTELRLRVFDLRGRERARFAVPSGTDWFEWDGRDENGRILGSGRYFLALADRDGAVTSFVWLR